MIWKSSLWKATDPGPLTQGEVSSLPKTRPAVKLLSEKKKKIWNLTFCPTFTFLEQGGQCENSCTKYIKEKKNKPKTMLFKQKGKRCYCTGQLEYTASKHIVDRPISKRLYFTEFYSLCFLDWPCKSWLNIHMAVCLSFSSERLTHKGLQWMWGQSSRFSTFCSKGCTISNSFLYIFLFFF